MLRTWIVRSAGFAARLVDALGIAADTLWAHRLRSALTVLGIVIGIAAVVLVGSAIEALRLFAVNTTAQAFGTNTFLISQVASVGNLSRTQLADKLRRNPEIERREAESLSREVRQETRIASTQRANADVKFRNRVFKTAFITGSTANLEIIKDIRVAQGRFFTEEENRRARPVAVIGQDLVDEFFPSLDPLGREIKVRGRPFQVVGVQEKQGSALGSSQDRNVWIPLNAFAKIWGNRKSLTLYAQPADGQDPAASEEDTRVALRQLRRLKPGSEDNFDILNAEAGRSFIGRLTGMIGLAIIPISSVALLVAGIVVMNMMLVSVTERTQEIGIRKALGARKIDILNQILLESGCLCLLGGAAGLGVSYLGTRVMSVAFGSPVGIPPTYAALALTVSGIIGIGAGVYPAYMAAKQPPVVAMRAEI